ncbi:MAG: DUF296 domain-containing protein [Clostridia bacterium]|nr:DUF296 domain-containing protein [Clostridia bacterium]
MQYKKFGDTYLVRIDLGEEIMRSLQCFCEKEKISLARVEAIGAANRAVIGVYDLGEQVYHRQELNRFLEITSLNGSITRKDGAPYLHLHGTLADAEHTLYGGHILELTVGATCEMFVTVLPGEANRIRDDRLGINIIDV